MGHPPHGHQGRSASAARCWTRGAAHPIRSTRASWTTPAASSCSAARCGRRPPHHRGLPPRHRAASRAWTSVRGRTFTLDFQNEFTVGWLDDDVPRHRPGPHLRARRGTGEAIGTEVLRYGQRVRVVALPAPAILTHAQGAATTSGPGPSATISTSGRSSPARSHEAHRHRRGRHQHRRGAHGRRRRGGRGEDRHHRGRHRRHPPRPGRTCWPRWAATPARSTR